MKRSPTTRENLEQLLELAQAANGWSRRKLAKALGRDASKLVPASGVPKLDLVIKLANVLEWRLTDVVDRIWGEEGGADYEDVVGRSFDQMNEHARKAHREGRFREMVEFAKKSFAVANSPDERAQACQRECGGWDGLGCFTQALRAVQLGLEQPFVSVEYRRVLQSSLANAYLGLGSLAEARSVAVSLVDWYANHPAESVRDRKSATFSHFVSGQSLLQMGGNSPSDSAALLEQARLHLEEAYESYTELASELDDQALSGIANSCRGALDELAVMEGRMRPLDALRRYVEGLEAVVDCSECRSGDWLESYGWWCISGANVATRYLPDDQIAQRYLAIFTNKADEIAEHLDNWSFRKSVVTLDFRKWARHESCGEDRDVHLLDAQDVRSILGSMGRFPSFRDSGWRILRSAGLA